MIELIYGLLFMVAWLIVFDYIKERRDNRQHREHIVLLQDKLDQMQKLQQELLRKALRKTDLKDTDQ